MRSFIQVLSFMDQKTKLGKPFIHIYMHTYIQAYIKTDEPILKTSKS